MADVAMGETPTYGKIEVKQSPTGRRKTNRTNSSSTTSTTAATDSSDGDGVDAETGADAAEQGETTSKCVEWYGTIRLLVFVRKGELVDQASCNLGRPFWCLMLPPCFLCETLQRVRAS